MKIAIRVDASLKIGTGHVVRCLTLADELKLNGANIVFICRNLSGNLIQYIEEKSYTVLKLIKKEFNEDDSSSDKYQSYDDWLETSARLDAEETNALLKSNNKFDFLIVDHYSINERWEKEQKKVVNKIFVIDDLANRKHDCDFLLDQNFYLDMHARYKNLIENDCNVLIGPKYAILRSDFKKQRKKTNLKKEAIKKLFIFYGGVDFTNMTAKTLRAIMPIVSDDIVADVVIGATNPHRAEIESLCNSNKNINLHVQAKNMAQLMADADLSIGSGGTVTWERMCVGLPSIVWPVADNQVKLLKDCSAKELVYLPDDDSPTIEDIFTHIKYLINNVKLCNDMREKGMALVDGKGVTRIASVILPPLIDLVTVKKEDVEKIFKWRNEPVVRKYSRDSSEINFDDHKKWFDRVLQSDKKILLKGIISNNEIGVLRFDFMGDEVEISIYLRKEMIGKGYAVAFIKAGENWLYINHPNIKSIVAEILPENKASINLFKKCEYKQKNMKFIKSMNHV